MTKIKQVQQQKEVSGRFEWKSYLEKEWREEIRKEIKLKEPWPSQERDIYWTV